MDKKSGRIRVEKTWLFMVKIFFLRKCKKRIFKYLNEKKGSIKPPFAVRTGLEPATPCVTGTYSNQLNYRTNIFKNFPFFRCNPYPGVLVFGFAKIGENLNENKFSEKKLLF